MKVLNVKVSAPGSYNYALYANGRETEYKKDKFGNRLYKIETEESSVNVKLVAASVYGGKRWSFFAVFLFLISIFGLFAPKRRETGKGFAFEANYDLSDGEIFSELKLNKDFSADGEAFAVTGATEVTKNFFYTDEEVKARVKKMKAVKWIIAVSVLLAVSAMVLIWGIKK